eukprot:840603-Lingulodinium_polyedra.AAC.1
MTWYSGAGSALPAATKCGSETLRAAPLSTRNSMPRHREPAPALPPFCALQGVTYSTRRHCWTAR